MNPVEMNVKINDKKLIEEMVRFKEMNKVNNVTLCEMALRSFFDDKRNQLKCLSKEQLIDMLMKGENNESTKN